MKIEIGIAAYNEEANIAKVLGAIAQQELGGHEVVRILLISDGSSDKTVQRAKAVGLKNLEVIDDRQRRGKSARLLQLFQLAKAEVLVLLDADVLPGSNHVIADIIQPIVAGKATLTSGRPLKLNTNKFFDKVMGVSAYLQDYIKTHVDDGSSVYACHGRLIAIRRSIYSKPKPPITSVGNDAYLYFFNKSQGGTFRYVPSAIVRYKMPQTFADYARQQRRFRGAQAEQAKAFGAEILDEYKLSPGLMLRALLSCFVRHPVTTVIYIAAQIKARHAQPPSAKEQWQISESTKEL